MDLRSFKEAFGNISNIREVHREYCKMLSGLCPTCILAMRLKGDGTTESDLCESCKAKITQHTAKMNELLGGNIAQLPGILRRESAKAS